MALLCPAADHAQKKTAHAAEQERPDILRRRQEWFDDQLDLDPARLVFIDETWASTNMARRYGRALRGQRLRASVPHGHWKTVAPAASISARTLLYLPPYSPDFNPIENAFAKLKALLRKAAERTIDGLWAAIGRLIDTFTPSECANYFTAAGYDAT